MPNVLVGSTLLAVAVAAAVASTASVAAADPLQPLATFLAGAETSNPDIREAASVVEQRVAESDAAWDRLWPSFTARGAYTRNEVASQIALGGPGAPVITIVPENQLDAALTLEVPLVDVTSWQRIGASSAFADAARARAGATKLDVSRSLARQYFQLVAARALRRAADQTLAAAQANAAVVTQRRDAGRGSDLDVERAAAEVERARQAGADAVYLEAIAARALRSASGLTPGAGSDDDAARVLDGDLGAEGPLEAWERGMTSPVVDAAAAEARGADRNASAARAALLPVVSGVAQERFTNAPGFTNRNALWSAGVALTWRLDLATVANVRAQDAGARAATARRERAEIAARDRVHDDWQLVDAAVAKSRSARAQVIATEQAVRMARDRYASGVATQLDVIQAERDTFAASVARIQTDAELAYARAALRLDAGREDARSRQVFGRGAQ